MTADELTEERPIGRRERKLQQTRSSLTRSALELFAERGFDAVTVVDIANRSDVDPSTFFRHFRSKEALLFTDMDNYVAMIRPLLDERPADEPLIESFRAVNLHISETYDYELENLRAELSESSAELHAQGVIHRERIVVDLTQLIGEHLGIDAQSDPRPYLAATVWTAAFGWFRRRKVSTHQRLENTATAVNDIVDIVQSTGTIFLLSPGSSAKRTKIS
ncbi:MAG: TetR family transcriptional regulator [Pseudonocardiales bacterium]|nr:TetR family transcriptional regulator [Pseudonocardiales bacterium]